MIAQSFILTLAAVTVFVGTVAGCLTCAWFIITSDGRWWRILLGVLGIIWLLALFIHIGTNWPGNGPAPR